MNNCANHKKEVAGISDMKLLAEMIGDLHYETLSDFLKCLSDKLHNDSARDFKAGKEKLSHALSDAAYHITDAEGRIHAAWQISKPFMNTDTLKL